MPVVKITPPDPSKPFEMPVMDVSGISRKYLDIDYTPNNPHPMRKLDIYLPENGNGPFPTLICIHGGAFTGGKKDDFQVAAYIEGIAEGFAVVSVEQRLCSMKADGTHEREGEFPNPIFDFKAAIRFLKVNAGKYMLDPSRFATCGGSAGGYHAVMAALTQNVSAFYDDSLGFNNISEEVHAVVDWFGVGDLVIQSEFTDKTPMIMPDGSEFKIPNYADVFLGVPCREHTNLAYFASPETWVTKDLPPVLLQAGAADQIVPVECSRRLAKRIEEVCGKDRVTYDEFEDYTHGDIRFNDPANLDRMFKWLKEKLDI